MAVELSIINGLKELVNMQDQLLQKDFVLEQLYSLSSDAIVVLNNKKQVISYSKAFKELVNEKDILGESFFKLVSKITLLPNDFFNESSYFIKVNTNESSKIFEARVSKLFNNFHQIDRYIIILKDIDKQQELQEEKDNFIATLTHDLKTPVRANILSLELLLKGDFGKLSKEQNELIQEILNSNKFMMSMLDTLLAKYKYESQNIQLNKTIFNINEFIIDCISDVKSFLTEKNIKCELNLTNKSATVKADKLELKRAVINLLTNAIKFNNKNGFIKVSIIENNNSIKIIVEDTGIGIEANKLEHIFDKYVSYAKRFRALGTGLGLYVAKKVIEAHCGEISVSSVCNQGSIFTITLPSK